MCTVIVDTVPFGNVSVYGFADRRRHMISEWEFSGNGVVRVLQDAVLREYRPLELAMVFSNTVR